MASEYRAGLRDGLAIGVGYFSVSFTFGILAVNGGLSALTAGLISLTNLTSAGQFAGLTVILAHGSLFELALTQLVINLRYALMSLSLSQRLGPAFTTRRRMVVAFANTDEIFAVAMGRSAALTPAYMYGLATLPILGWTGGTLTGIGEALKAAIPSVRVVAVEPSDSPVLSQGRSGAHKLQGLGAGFCPPVLNRQVYDEVMTVRNDVAYDACRAIARTEGLLLGISSGAALFAATQLAKRVENRGKTIVAVMPDTGERYLSANLFGE